MVHLARAEAYGTTDAAVQPLIRRRAERLQLTGATAGEWRRRLIERRINGLYDELRPGKPRSVDDERVAGLLRSIQRDAAGRITGYAHTGNGMP